jgi:VWFA-related protein
MRSQKMNRSRVFATCVLALCAFAQHVRTAASAPLIEASPEQRLHQAAQADTIQVATRLVQVGVIVEDKNVPVTDLTPDDFLIFDRGKPQKISFFSLQAAPTASTPQSAALPPGTFSNLPQNGSASPSSITIVLLDNLNTLYGSASVPYEQAPRWLEEHALSYGKAHLIEFVEQMKPGDRVAIYGLSDSLHVLCDFTCDRAELLAILKRYDTTAKTSREITEPGATHTPVPGEEFNSYIDGSREALAGAANQNRAQITLAALQSIAAHVANIPGRKNLVWLTANLPFSGAAIANILGYANIAAYPVDARGLMPETASLKLLRNGIDGDDLTLGHMPAQSERPIGIDTMQDMAQLTGGQAFVNTNDITAAIRKAVENSDVTYTLGFYIDARSADGKFHELKIEVKRKGLTVRFQRGYFAYANKPASKDLRQDKLITAVRSPIESATIPFTASFQKAAPGTHEAITVTGLVDLRAVGLGENGATHQGGLDIDIFEQDETGKVLAVTSDRIPLRFTAWGYSKALETGIRFQKTILIPATAATLRVVVQNPGTGELGSLIIPLTQIK